MDGSPDPTDLKVGWDGAQYLPGSGTFLFPESGGMFETPERPKKDTRRALREGKWDVWLVVLEGLLEEVEESKAEAEREGES